MNVTATDLPGVIVVEPDVYRDHRGAFLETWNESRYPDLPPFVQDNLSRSRRGVLRGLHYQFPNPQGKLVSVAKGRVWDVAVDVRRGSPTFGRWFGVELSDQDFRQLYIPEGFAHGFVTLSEEALVQYKCTALYAPACEQSIRWDDPALDIDWPMTDPILSDKDRAAPTTGELDPEALPEYRS